MAFPDRLASTSNPAMDTFHPIFLKYDGARITTSTLRVDALKLLIKTFDTFFSLNLRPTGLKGQLIDKVLLQFNEWKTAGDSMKFSQAIEILTSIKQFNRAPDFVHLHRPAPPTTQYEAPSAASYLSQVQRSSLLTQQQQLQHQQNLDAQARAAQLRYRAQQSQQAQQSLQQQQTSAQAAALIAAANRRTPLPQIRQIAFAPSAFYEIIEPLSPIHRATEAKEGEHRKTLPIRFSLTGDVISRISDSMSLHGTGGVLQVRLYSASADYWVPTKTVNTPAPIEFPSNGDAKINGMALKASIRGFKKQPGTAPPIDLGGPLINVSSRCGLKTQPTVLQEVVISYANSPKVHYLQVNLVRVTTIPQLITKSLQNRKSKETVIKEYLASKDDEIALTDSTLSLKCPLSFIRIKHPLRSKKCGHLQCFDAQSFFSIMEQAPTWKCPVDHMSLSIDDLIVDGYFEDLLARIPDSEDSVTILSNAEWHTENFKYTSPGFVPSMVEGHEEKKYKPVEDNIPKESEKSTAVFTVIDDSDEEASEEGEVVEKPPMHRSSGSASMQQGSSQSLRPNLAVANAIGSTLVSANSDSQALQRQHYQSQQLLVAQRERQAQLQRQQQQQQQYRQLYQNQQQQQQQQQYHHQQPVPHNSSGSIPRQSSRVIDLTLDDTDEEDNPEESHRQSSSRPSAYVLNNTAPGQNHKRSHTGGSTDQGEPAQKKHASDHLQGSSSRHTYDTMDSW